jgi:[NiFe] hydrogenase assembly HybE family chaperone
VSGTRECGVCWYAYDPAAGDDVWQVPKGTEFDQLPPDWRCPRCDSAKERFLPPRDAPPEEKASPDPRVGLLEAAYRHIHQTRMQGLPILNPRLEVEAVGFVPFDGGLLGALVTPWTINAVFFPPPGPPPPELGRSRALPSGRYTFLPQTLPGLGTVELASIFSTTLQFEDHSAAVATAREAVRLLLTPPAPEEPATPPAAQARPPAPSRRDLFTGFGARRPQ